MKVWTAIPEGESNVYQLIITLELIQALQLTRFEILEPEYAKKGEPAITASGVLGSAALTFPCTGPILGTTEDLGVFRVRVFDDFDPALDFLPDINLEMPNAVPV